MVLACGRGCEAQTSTGSPETIGLGPPGTCVNLFTDYSDLLVSTGAETLAKNIGDRETQRACYLREKLAVLMNNGFLYVGP